MRDHAQNDQKLLKSRFFKDIPRYLKFGLSQQRNHKSNTKIGCYGDSSILRDVTIIRVWRQELWFGSENEPKSRYFAKKTIKYLKISIVLTVLLHEINILLHFKKDNKMVCDDNCMERCGVLLCKVIIMCNTVKLSFSAEAFFLRFLRFIY